MVLIYSFYLIKQYLWNTEQREDIAERRANGVLEEIQNFASLFIYVSDFSVTQGKEDK